MAFSIPHSYRFVFGNIDLFLRCIGGCDVVSPTLLGQEPLVYT